MGVPGQWFTNDHYTVEPLDRRILLTSVVPKLPLVGTAIVDVSFTLGAVVADRDRNVVYVEDQTASRLIEVGTDSGRIVGEVPLHGKVGELTVAIDDKTLFASEPADSQIEMFSLPNLTKVKTISLATPVRSIAAGSNGRLFATTRVSYSQLEEIDVNSGAVAPFGRSGYSNGIVRTNSDGTRVFAGDYESGGPDSAIDEYSTELSVPYFPKSYLAANENREDFAIDDANDRVYVSSSTPNGVEVLDLKSGARSTWAAALGSSNYERALAFTATSSLFGGSKNNIRQYRRGDGAALADYNLGNYKLGEMAITPNGRVFYTAEILKEAGNQEIAFWRAGLIGGTNLTLEEVPTAKIVATPAGPGTFHFDGTQSAPFSSAHTITQWDWDFGDGTSGSGSVVDHLYTDVGFFIVTLKVTSSNSLSATATQTVQIGQPVGSQYGSISGKLFEDWDGSGTRNEMEDPLQGRYVYIDVNKDGAYEQREPWAKTNSGGNYLFSAIPAGTWSVRQILPDNWDASMPASRRWVTIASASNVKHQNFGSRRRVSMSGTLFEDLNGNKFWNPGEPLLSNWQIFVDADGDGVLDPDEISVRSHANGQFQLPPSPAGKPIGIVLPSGWVLSSLIDHVPSINVDAVSRTKIGVKPGQ